ncbi:MAG: ABC transporter ATP-binding protein [Flavobacteriales bacterium]|nr:ABC transporter ATP-binding protein [Flavobacteriales bacterium]MCB9190817.1 ABC transporter ATP-binding protein [Flavobacteriales bacterium]
MHSYWGIVGLLRNYKGLVFVVVLMNILSVIFSLFSLTMVVPLLGVLFGIQPIVTEMPPVTLNPNNLIDLFYYEVSQLILDETGQITLDGQMKALVFICVFVVVTFFLKNMFRYLALFFSAPLKNGVVRDIRNQIYHKVVNLPLAYFSEEKKGDVIAKMTSDVQEVESSIMSSVEVVFKEPFTIIFFLGTLIVWSPELTMFVLILLPVTGLLIGRVGKSLKRSSKKVQKQMGVLVSAMIETLSGLRIIKAFNAIDTSYEKFQRINEEYKNQKVRMIRKQHLASPLSEVLGTLVMVTVIYYGGSLVLGGGDLKADLFIGYIVVFSQLIQPSKALTSSIYMIQKGMAAAERISTVLDAEETISEKPNAVTLEKFEKQIEFKDVSFSYDNGMEVLSNVNLTIKRGKTVAIVGPSGAGKTTLVDLVPRFYDPCEGAVLIDGIDTRDMKAWDLRAKLGIVTQEAILFNDTVYNNIAFGLKDVPESEVMNAAKVANAHDFIVQMDKGYHTSIGEDGSKLSGGQRQRISIARAILHNPPILILDEATSALDAESEKLVQDALFKLMENRTSLIIAHRLSTIQYADEIIVIDQGKIIERGNHMGLIAHNGVYKKLYEMQAFV